MKVTRPRPERRRNKNQKRNSKQAKNIHQPKQPKDEEKTHQKAESSATRKNQKRLPKGQPAKKLHRFHSKLQNYVCIYGQQIKSFQVRQTTFYLSRAAKPQSVLATIIVYFFKFMIFFLSASDQSTCTSLQTRWKRSERGWRLLYKKLIKYKKFYPTLPFRKRKRKLQASSQNCQKSSFFLFCRRARQVIAVAN